MKLRTLTALSASWLVLAGVAAAQEAAPVTDEARDARIRELEERLNELATQLADLKESAAADSADVRRIQAEQTQVTLANGRPAFATPDGNFRAAIRGVFQFDAAQYLQDDNLSPSASVQDLNSGANFRRARLGIEGTAYRDWNYALTYEAGGSGVEASGLQQAWIEYAGWKPFGLTAPVRFRAGAFAVENTLEGATSNTDQLFLERPSVAELVRGQFGGDGRNAFGIYANGDRLTLSAIVTGSTLSNADVSPAGNANDEAFGYVTRIGALVLRGENSGLHLGANYSATTQLADSSAGANTIQLRERPELRVDSNGTSNATARLVDTGAFTADNARAFGVEAGYQWKNFFLASEWQQIDVDRPGVLRDPSFNGYYVQGAWTITGEQHKWNAVSGGFAGIRPTNAFNPGADHWGAFEVAARYSFLDLNDNEGSAGAATPAGGFRGGEQTITTIGLNWYPNNVVRLLLDLQDVEVDRLNGAGVQIGQDYQAVALRTQVSF
jgi:phosphate-selective porin OprO/OprP